MTAAREFRDSETHRTRLREFLAGETGTLLLRLLDEESTAIHPPAEIMTNGPAILAEQQGMRRAAAILRALPESPSHVHRGDKLRRRYPGNDTGILAYLDADDTTTTPSTDHEA